MIGRSMDSQRREVCVCVYLACGEVEGGTADLDLRKGREFTDRVMEFV